MAREHAVPCQRCGLKFRGGTPHPSTYTYNDSALCDEHEKQEQQEFKDIQIFETVEEARNDFA